MKESGEDFLMEIEVMVIGVMVMREVTHPCVPTTDVDTSSSSSSSVLRPLGM